MEEPNQNLLDINNSSETSESSQLKSENNQKQIGNKTWCEKILMPFQNVGGEIWFALTFIGRIIMTLYSLHGLFFIYNFIIEFIILIPGRLYDLDSVALQWIFGIFYILFSMVSSNVLVIPTYEFFLFPYLNFRYPFAHLHSLIRVKYVINDEKEKLKKDGDENSIENKNVHIINFFLIIMWILYVIGFLMSLITETRLKDYVKLVILFIIYTYYALLLIGYILISTYIMYKLMSFSFKKNKGCFNAFIQTFDFNSFFGDPEKKKLFTINDDNNDKDVNDPINSKENERDLPPLPKLNLFSYVMHPVLMKAYKFEDRQKYPKTRKKHCEDYYLYVKNIFRLLLFFYALLLVILDLIKEDNRKEFSAVIYFIIFFIAMLLLSIVLNFPIFCRNKKTFGIGGFFTGKVKLKPEYKMRYPNLITFIRLMCNAIITLSAIVLFAIFNAFKESNTLKDLYDITFESAKNHIDTTSLLLPNLCFSSVHHIPIYLYMPFINDAYYYNDKDKDFEHYYYSSLQIPSYKDFFYDDSYEFENIKSLIKGKEGESVKMVQYNIIKKTDKENKVTILAIKGTTNKKDAFIDFQLYFPSILLNLLSTFSIQGQQKETYSFKFIEYSLSIPYRLFFQYSLIQSYLNDLRKAYNENYNSFHKKIIIVGHSLGGGLAKLLGRLLNKQAISLSGPGVNAFHSLWGYEGNSENFELSAIDLVPDMDLVPRVEVSGGTTYRIICKAGPFACHSKVLSLCEVLIMCRNPNYYNYCSKLGKLSDEKIKELYESSEMNYNFK